MSEKATSAARAWGPSAITQSIRRFGGSINTVVLYDGEGNSFVELLKAAVKTARECGNQGDGAKIPWHDPETGP